MKVIDADKFCNFLNRYPLKKAQDNFMNLYRDCLRYICKCEKDAIPVEWLKKKYNEADSAGMGIDDWSVKDCYGYVIEAWEKENAENDV